ncbi:MAG: PspC domain-containing protein [Spirochaetales bacterium]|nr:PspC domain-containing protein [Spirochaetales bacterium]
MMAYSAKKLYRSRNGKIFGICQGIADWRDLPVDFIRLFMILAFLFTGFFPVGILYFLAALLIPLEPAGYRDSFTEGNENRKDRYENVRRDFNDLKDRVRNMEGRVFDKERDWDERFKKDK